MCLNIGITLYRPPHQGRSFTSLHTFLNILTFPSRHFILYKPLTFSYSHQLRFLFIPLSLQQLLSK
ncbi:hypothetical protein MtrunA17_Chr1g0155421 [Medicago truncatula]|uniref:Uncharacterized protein n=1 Tax=Medicago truncatula TaxID=3880 RepID=A0A396JMI0_MEDTR|nr:hypothetical protein MtrunA17_Chr1g0155421 [Medicago truncatula]